MTGPAGLCANGYGDYHFDSASGQTACLAEEG